MKTAALLLALFSVATAFAPQQAGSRASTQLNEKKPLFDSIFEMDLFSPVKEQNNYGARKNKNIKLGSIGANSYVPSGLTPAQYEAIRKKEAEKKEQNYKKNVDKAFKYLGFDEFYLKRGTDLDGAWKKSQTLGHRMAKTKFDWGKNSSQQVKKFEAFSVASKAEKAAPKKK